MENDRPQIRSYYLKLYSGDTSLCFNIWNFGEVLAVCDRLTRRKILDKSTHKILRERLLSGSMRMHKIERLKIIPLCEKIIEESWAFIEENHIYQAEAIQLVSARNLDAAEFVTGNKNLGEIAKNSGLNTTLVYGAEHHQNSI